jgi:hypothetical protein
VIESWSVGLDRNSVHTHKTHWVGHDARTGVGKDVLTWYSYSMKT